MWLPYLLSALWLAAQAYGALQRDEDGSVKSIALRTHSLYQPYLDSEMRSRWYDFGGNTIVRTDQYIRLTSDFQSQSGWLFSRVPLTATNWVIEVQFKIHGKNQMYGDGLAMWITKERAKQGPVFGSADNFEGLGIFIDTYKNNRPGVVFPYVMAMVGDGKTSYDKTTDGKGNEFAGCSARGMRNANIPTKLRLTYFQDKKLKLDLQYKTEGDWQLCFETDSPPLIPQVAYLGFSAETGELTDNHDIISVNAKNLYSAQPVSDKSTPGSGRGRKPLNQKTPGSWLWLLVKIIFFGLVIVGAYVGYNAWKNKPRAHRF